MDHPQHCIDQRNSKKNGFRCHLEEWVSLQNWVSLYLTIGGFLSFFCRPPDGSNSQLQRQQHLWKFLLYFPDTILCYDNYCKCWIISQFKAIILEVFIFNNTLVVDICANIEWKRHYTKKTIYINAYSGFCWISVFKAELCSLSRQTVFAVKTPLTVPR